MQLCLQVGRMARHTNRQHKLFFITSKTFLKLIIPFKYKPNFYATRKQNNNKQQNVEMETNEYVYEQTDIKNSWQNRTNN